MSVFDLVDGVRYQRKAHAVQVLQAENVDGKDKHERNGSPNEG